MRDKNMKQKILECSGSFHDSVVESLRKDPEEALIYLQVALEEYQEDGNVEFFMLALKTVAEAVDGKANKLTRQKATDRQQRYRALSSKSSPDLKTIGPILNDLGFQLSVSRLADADSKGSSLV